MSGSQRYDSVQMLRGIAALMVAVFHLATHSNPEGPLLADGNPVKQLSLYGPTGVFVFFVISGFVLPFAMNKSGYQLSKFPPFMAKRLIRLEPPYLATLALILLSGLAYAIKDNTDFILDPARFFSHFLYMSHIAGQEWYNPIFWTLAIEFQYYILIALTFSWINSDLWWKRATWIVVMAAINIAFPDDRFIFNYISPFILGFVAYYLMIKRLSKWEVLPYILITFWLMMQYFGRDWAIAAFFTFFFIYFINGVNKWLDWLGEISYSLYLTHGLSGGSIIYLLMEHYHQVWQRIVILFIGIAGSILFAWIFYRIVELPAKRWASRL